MNINVLNTNYERTTIVDDFTSLMWCTRYADIGAIDLEIEATTENLNIFKKGFYITRDDDDTIFRIEKIEIDTDETGNDKLIIGAIDCKCILNQRITWSQIALNNSDVQSFISAMITNNFISPSDAKRRINLAFDTNSLTNGIGLAVTRQSTYDSIGDKIIDLCKTYDLGWKVYFNQNDKKFHVKLINGVDRSINQNENDRVVFSNDNDNLFSSKYDFDMSESKNVALVGGEGEGTERKLQSVGNASGLDRRETFVDAKSVKDEEELIDYNDVLINEGKNALAEMVATSKFEAEIDSSSFLYKTDYNIGDVVTVKNDYGIIMTARIVEIIETWDNTGYTLEPVFEYIEVVVDFTSALLTEELDTIMSENSDLLLVETPAFLTENELEILTEDNKIISVE